MEDRKRRAFIKQRATARKNLEGSQPPKMGHANPSTKRKLLEKGDHPPKKPKVGSRLTVGETPAINKLPPKPSLGKGKGLMKGQVLATEEQLVLLRKDLSYALKQLLSIINDDDYSDLGNHVIEAMGETSLFSLAQVCLSIHLCLFFSNIVLLNFVFDFN